MSKRQYSNKSIASAIEGYVNGESQKSISERIGCANNTISRWMCDYWLYKKEGELIIKKSKV